MHITAHLYNVHFIYLIFYTELIPTSGPQEPKSPINSAFSVLHFKQLRYCFCHARPPIVRGSGATGGHCQTWGVDVKMVGSEVVTLIVRQRVGGGPRGCFQPCVSAVRTGPRE